MEINFKFSHTWKLNKNHATENGRILSSINSFICHFHNRRPRVTMVKININQVGVDYCHRCNQPYIKLHVKIISQVSPVCLGQMSDQINSCLVNMDNSWSRMVTESGVKSWHIQLHSIDNPGTCPVYTYFMIGFCIAAGTLSSKQKSYFILCK